MLTPILLILAILAIAIIFVVIPVIVITFRWMDGETKVHCPGVGLPASIQVDAQHAAFTAAFGRPDLRVEGCSLWPDFHNCGQACLKQLSRAEA